MKEAHNNCKFVGDGRREGFRASAPRAARNGVEINGRGTDLDTCGAAEALATESSEADYDCLHFPLAIYAE